MKKSEKKLLAEELAGLLEEPDAANTALEMLRRLCMWG
jgi:hypothetical protein